MEGGIIRITYMHHLTLMKRSRIMTAKVARKAQAKER
jgi:hypothetical protein